MLYVLFLVVGYIFARLHNLNINIHIHAHRKD